MADYCYICEGSGVETEAGHFVGPRSTHPLLEDKRGRPLCDFHWWLIFESPSSRGGISWAEYTQKWAKPEYPKLTWPADMKQVVQLKKPRKKRSA